MEFALDSSDLDRLDDSQKDALMEALMFALFADSRIEAAEVQQFERLGETIPWGIPREALISRMHSARDAVIELANKGDAEAITARIEQVTGKLGDLGVKVFHAMASIMVADDALTGDEKNVMVVFASRFGLIEDNIAAIRADLEGRDPG